MRLPKSAWGILLVGVGSFVAGGRLFHAPTVQGQDNAVGRYRLMAGQEETGTPAVFMVDTQTGHVWSHETAGVIKDSKGLPAGVVPEWFVEVPVAGLRKLDGTVAEGTAVAPRQSK